jgi:predicted RNase H-like HicB family nuclease
MEREIRLFTGIIDHNEGSAYGITFPDVPGCFAAKGRHWR